VQYALQSSTAPVAVSRYELPADVRRLLPGDDQLRRIGRQTTSNPGLQPKQSLPPGNDSSDR